MHEHKPNSCCYYFICTFDNSRNELKTFEGSNCVKEMIIDMYNKSLECYGEMKINTAMKLIQKDNKHFEKVIKRC